MKKWPTQAQIEQALKEMKDAPSSRPLSNQANPVEKLKYSVCSQFVVYMRTHQLTQQQLADQLGLDKAIVSKITHYHFDEFTSDRLIKYLSILDPNLQIEVKAKVA